jgi:hypothetical protein
MRPILLKLLFLAPLVYALDCQQNYVQVAQILQMFVEDLPGAYSEMNTVVTKQLNTGCIASNDAPAFDPPESCWTFTDSVLTLRMCGFRLWRTYKSCSSLDLTEQLNTAFIQYAIQNKADVWVVNDTQPTGDCHCG